MRMPTYLSPTSVTQWDKDRAEFYRKYLCDTRFPRMPQTEPMSVGSSFDAYVKNYLAVNLGMEEAKGELELNKLLTDQIEPHNRDFAIPAGKYCFDQYKKLGATAELMKELQLASSTPKFEFTVQSTVEGQVPLLGKPDLYFHTKEGDLCIYDWKVNGYCSKSGASPRKGYLRLLADGKPTATHKLVHAMYNNGINMDVANKMEDLDVSWATQLAIYGWVLDGVGKKIIAGIDQLACKPGPMAPTIRVAALRNHIGQAFQDKLWSKCLEIWTRIQAGNIFDEDNEETIQRLDTEAGAFVMDGDSKEDWYNGIMRRHKF